MKDTKLKAKLKNNEATIGSWITIPHQSVIDILAEINFDWLCIDLEHTPIDYNELQVLIGFIQARNIAALVRVSKNEEVVIKRALDAGADGIIVPMTCTGEEAQQAVDFAKYPPVGKRGVGLSRAQRYGFGFDSYKDWVSEHLIVIAQVEHIVGVNNIEAIIATPGIDAVFIGPYDLSGSLGITGQYNEPVFIDSMKKVELACKDKNMTLGYHVIEPNINLVKDKIAAGYNLIAFSTDYFFMARKAAEEMGKL